MDSDNQTNPTLPAIGDDSDSSQTPKSLASSVDDAPTLLDGNEEPFVNDYSDSLKAEDVDLIEKAWVEKAKAIVQSTEGDPFNQNKQLSKVKADYIKKRFDKDVRVGE